MKTPEALDLSAFCDGIIYDEERGIWRCRGGAQVSYPEDGHACNYAVEDQSFWFSHRNACILAALERFAPPEGPILDIGGGNGFVTRAMELAGHTAILLEPGAQGVANARARNVKNIIHAELKEAALRAGAFSGACAFDVVEHIEDDIAFLQEVRQLLAPGGKLFLTVPAHEALWSDADVRAGHFRRYNRGSLSHALNEAGYQVEYLSYFFRPLLPLVWLMRAVPSRVGIRRHKRPSGREVHGAGRTRGLARIVQRTLGGEVDRIVDGRVMRLGASLIAVAGHSHD